MFETGLLSLFIRLLTLVIAFPIHELGHALVAVALGDDTPRREGRLSLNPLVHLDPWGTLAFIVSGFGWARPVRVNPYALRQPRGMFLVALAGPLSNLGLALLAALLYRTLHPASDVLRYALYSFVSLNLILLFFNLLPLPPLDGSHLFAELFTDFWQRYIAPLEPYAPAILLILIFVLPLVGIDLLSLLVGLPTRWISNWLLFN